jgi:hypothetical protein
MAARMSSADLTNERLRHSIVSVEEGPDGGFEFLDAAMNTVTDLLGKETLDLVQPGTAGRRQMHVPAWTLCQPVADQRGLVRGIVVPVQMHVEIARHAGFDLIEKLAEFLCPMTRIALADHLVGGDIERSEQRGRPMPGVVVAGPLRLPGRIGNIAWLRSSAWICDFSSTHSTMACSGGAIYSRTSRTLATKSGSVDSLNVSCRCGFRPKARQIRCTVLTERPLSCAILRELQCVASSGWLSAHPDRSERRFRSDIATSFRRLLRRRLESAQYGPIKYTERLKPGIDSSVGSLDDSYDCEFMVLPEETDPSLRLTLCHHVDLSALQTAPAGPRVVAS